ncbi:hypothetical protein PIB30_081321 [Stylosanthes scabra]|uniref:Uncharacterized protein n=1 Tax=Stylosanthes scabra TaxID=79078 RepID=A0ABU6ZQG1_9FABA|nr:hypothetical protein [Stylosanthes scabra]
MNTREPQTKLVCDAWNASSSNGAVAGELNMCARFWLFVNISHSNPDLLVFDPEIERTLRRARQVWRRIEFENFLRSQTENLAAENISVQSSDSDSDTNFGTEKVFSPTRTSTSTMGNLPWMTLKQLDFEQKENFELKSGLINLLPRFHGMPGEDPIKHLRDFDVICTTTRRTGVM